MQFLMSVIDTVANSGTAEEQAAIEVFNHRMIADGNWVFAGGLSDPADATTVDHRGEQPLLTDGPFVETKEFLSGFWIIEAADFDVALALAVDASKACHRKVELRPVLGPPDGG